MAVDEAPHDAMTESGTRPSGRGTERERVEAWRLETALELGVPLPVAEKFAVTLGADLHRLAELVGRGCPPLTAARILI